MPRDTPPEGHDPTLDAALGPDRAAALQTELAAVGFAIVGTAELTELRRESEALARLRSLALGDDT
ncbi:MAG: hypothetical protein ACTHN0_15085 [Aquihabitans sp.]